MSTIHTETTIDEAVTVHHEARGDDHSEPIQTEPTPAEIPVLRQLGVALGLLILVFSTTYVGTLVALFDPETETQPSDIYVSATVAADALDAQISDPFHDLTVAGAAAFVWDVREGQVLFNKNADEVLPLASITKLMTALVAYELLDDDASINISIDAIETDGDSGLKDGETFSLKNLTDMVLVASSNDGAAALSAAAGSVIDGAVDPQAVFVRAMNIRATELGLTHTRFLNATGLDISETEAGAYSSARDVALLMEYIITKYPEVTHLTTSDEMYIYNERGERHDVENTNNVVNAITGVIASKTGYTALAGGNLVVAFEAGLNRPLIAVVLGSTFNGRFSDMLELTKRAQQYVTDQAE